MGKDPELGAKRESHFNRHSERHKALFERPLPESVRLMSRRISQRKHYIALTGRWQCDIVAIMNNKFFDNWTNQVRKGMLELCILNDIRNRKMYGYEIVRRLREIEGLVISEGAIYPILSRLKRQGFVETSIRESAEGPARKYYELTGQGREMVSRMNDYWRAISGVTDSIEKGQEIQ